MCCSVKHGYISALVYFRQLIHFTILATCACRQVDCSVTKPPHQGSSSFLPLVPLDTTRTDLKHISFPIPKPLLLLHKGLDSLLSGTNFS